MYTNIIMLMFIFNALHACDPETGRGRIFPDYNSNAAVCSLRNGDSYFGNELNFDAIPRMIITGAA